MMIQARISPARHRGRPAGAGSVSRMTASSGGSGDAEASSFNRSGGWFPGVVVMGGPAGVAGPAGLALSCPRRGAAIGDLSPEHFMVSANRAAGGAGSSGKREPFSDPGAAEVVREFVRHTIDLPNES